MNEPNSGFCWHVHHDYLMEWCYDRDKREAYIRGDKPESEQEVRLRLFQPIEAELPPALVEAGRAYHEAHRVCDEAWRKVSDTVGQVYYVAMRAYYVAELTCSKARQACDEVMRSCRAEIEASHAKECVDCPWDGKTIFPPD